MTKPIFRQYDMQAEMKKTEGAEFTYYAVYKFQRKSEYYKDRIGLLNPIFAGRK